MPLLLPKDKAFAGSFVFSVDFFKGRKDPANLVQHRQYQSVLDACEICEGSSYRDQL